MSEIPLSSEQELMQAYMYAQSIEFWPSPAINATMLVYQDEWISDYTTKNSATDHAADRYLFETEQLKLKANASW